MSWRVCVRLHPWYHNTSTWPPPTISASPEIDIHILLNTVILYFICYTWAYIYVHLHVLTNVHVLDAWGGYYWSRSRFTHQTFPPAFRFDIKSFLRMKKHRVTITKKTINHILNHPKEKQNLLIYDNHFSILQLVISTTQLYIGSFLSFLKLN